MIFQSSVTCPQHLHQMSEHEMSTSGLLGTAESNERASFAKPPSLEGTLGWESGCESNPSSGPRSLTPGSWAITINKLEKTIEMVPSGFEITDN